MSKSEQFRLNVQRGKPVNDKERLNIAIEYLLRIASPQGDVTKWLPETNTADLTRTYEDCAYEALQLIGGIK